MNALAEDFQLLAAVVIAIAGVAGAFIARGLPLKILVLAVGLIAAAYVAGVLPPASLLNAERPAPDSEGGPTPGGYWTANGVLIPI